MTSRSRHELFGDICRSPDDDALRLTYADLSVEFDPELAEFIRRQVARSADERQRHARSSANSMYEIDVKRRRGAEWSHYIQTFIEPKSESEPGYDFERGFIAYARVAIENVVGLGEKLYSAAPLQHLDVVRSADDDGDPVRVVKVKGYEHLDSVSFAGLKIGDRGAEALAECEGLRRAAWIDLSSNDIGRAGVIALARSPIFANKVRVFLSDNRFDPGEKPSLDWDGTIAEVFGSADEIEQEVGHRVAWLHYDWKTTADEPDRFHARWFARTSP